MNYKKVAFILCSNCKEIMEETKCYINSLKIPTGMEKEIIIIEDGVSMTEGYNRAMRQSDAKYKVYMHQDVFIVNAMIIENCIRIFTEHPEIGMLGVIGCKHLPEDGTWWEGRGCIGKTLEDNLQIVKLLELGKVEGDFEFVQAIDGQIMITQYDVPWREDICKGWHFYDTSQCLEFARKGYKTAVVNQDKPWVIHECGMDINIGYEAERIAFLEEYRQDLGKRDLLTEERIGILINGGRMEEANTLLKEYKVINNIYNDTMAILEASIYLNVGEKEKAFECISKGIKYNHKNYELYFMLGNYYLDKNKNQAFLCYENAEFYCNNEDRYFLTEVKNNLLSSDEVSVSPVSIVILSYNGKEMTSICIDSIQQSMSPEAYELILVDNASEDGSQEWIQEYQRSWKQKIGMDNLKVIYNQENKGFPAGCNQGIRVSETENDVFLLNNDTIVPPNAIFWLRMGLYENEKVGAVGSVSNHANNDQMVKEKKSSIEEWFIYGTKHNIPMRYPYEKKAWLMGFAIMFKRKALEVVGYLDERFTPGNYEDNDIGFRFLKAGYTQLLCKNSFIYHFGSVGFRKNQKSFDELLIRNRKKLEEKHGIPVEEYCWVRTDLLELIDKDPDEQISILDVGCGLGATMAKAEGIFPNSKVYGIEKNVEVAIIGKNLANIIQGDIEVVVLPFIEKSFDYIIIGNVLEYLERPEETVLKLLPYLKEKGFMLISISKAIKINEQITFITEKQIIEKIQNHSDLIIKAIEDKKADYILKVSVKST